METERTEPPSDSNESLFARYQRDGDQAAFERIAERETPELRKFIKRQRGGVGRGRDRPVVGTTIDVEDILQDTFSDLHECRESVTTDTKIRPLLYKIVKARLCDAIRAASRGKRDYRRTQCLEADATFTDTGRKVTSQFVDPKADPAVLDTKIELGEAMAKLPPTEEEAVRLVYVDGHTVPSAAAATEMPESTIKGRLQRGRQRLKELATTGLIVTLILGAIANQFDLDSPDPICTCDADTDDDIIREEQNGQHDVDRQRRKGLMRLLVGPDAARAIISRLAIDDEQPSVVKSPGRRQEASNHRCRTVGQLMQEARRYLRLRDQALHRLYAQKQAA